VFSLADPTALQSLVEDSGFTDVAVREVPTPARFTSAEQHFEVVGGLAGPVSAALAGGDEETLAAIKVTTGHAVERFRTDDGLVIPGLALLCTARA
jgi:hypothetical protein